MGSLEAEIRDIIRRAGPIDIAHYMTLCLSHPTYGYYRRSRPIGAEGDFITAPEVSQMFGELIGLWCAVVWQRMGEPTSVALVELGPGRGTLLSDALRAARGVPGFLSAAKIHLIESNDPLRRHQREALGHLQPTWHDTVETVPEGPAIVVANEFLDALPVRQFEWVGDAWHERVIALDDRDRLCFATTATNDPSLSGVTGVPGAIVEQSPAREALIGALAARIETDGGAALVIDYGSGHTAVGDTLQAVKRHARHPVLEDPGNADLTTHVDFGSLVAVARAAGAVTYGPVTQACFLRSMSIDARASALRQTASPEQATAIDTALERLTAADQMGVLFKAFAIVHPSIGVVPGFESVTPCQGAA